MTRLKADERREQILEVALKEFAERGLHGTSTESVARAAGISHAYLFRYFPTKRDLFAACAERCSERVRQTFRDAAARAEGDPLEEMGRAYIQMLEDRDVLLAQMQLWVAAASDEGAREIAQRTYGDIYKEIRELSNADAETARAFVAKGMLLNVAAAIDLERLAGGEAWVMELLPHLEQESVR